ncbi:hypothetical protein BRLA_c029140 [Brevibacillus laterosporus LMG 15441]|uniref:Uncharacterized protein n=1 Tax=Brevibacillus laterosporus LMG 15441 TaxID=1042163 RepID=A0A075R714_BRELA|nr:hypothetical protein BRLA_c029140 [Brevibacillus laterosporus LMG 15441]
MKTMRLCQNEQVRYSGNAIMVFSLVKLTYALEMITCSTTSVFGWSD